MQQSISGQRRPSVLKREGGKGGGGDGLIFHSAIRIDPSDVPKCPLILFCSLVQANFSAIFTVSSVSVIDLWQCISRQLFRPSCFMVLLSQFLSRLRAENVRSKVAYVKGIVKFIFKRVFWEPKGVGRSSPNFLRRLCLWQINVKRRLIWLFFFILNFAGERRLALLQGCWMLCFYIHARFTY